jgi:1-acyl-sn-glycerol-3-phosphate acyltransferase
MSYQSTRLLISTLVRLVARVEIEGYDNIPVSGGYIAVANHLGRIDAALIYYVLDRRDIIMLVAEKYRESAIARWLTRELDGIWVDRYGADLVAVRKTLDRLRRGGVLALSPEGTRSPTEALIKAQPGGAYLAAQSRLPILPVGITGSEDRLVFSQWKRLHRPHIKAHVGKPFTLAPIRRSEREQALQRYTDEIMCQIAALLPPKYHGVYADHPRLKELLTVSR